MKLYLVRHGEAGGPEQALTLAGAEEVLRVARFLKSQGVSPQRFLHSGKLRALQTAEILLTEIAPNLILEEREGLKPLDPIAPLINDLESLGESVLIVSHLPFLELLLSHLLFQQEAPIADFCGGAVAALSGEGDSWILSWFITPQLLTLRTE